MRTTLIIALGLVLATTFVAAPASAECQFVSQPPASLVACVTAEEGFTALSGSAGVAGVGSAGVGVAQLQIGTFTFTGGSVSALTAHDSPVGQHGASVSAFCFSFSEDPCESAGANVFVLSGGDFVFVAAGSGGGLTYACVFSTQGAANLGCQTL